MEQVALNRYQKERKGSHQLRKYTEKKCELQPSICYFMKDTVVSSSGDQTR